MSYKYLFAGCLFWGGIVSCVSMYLYMFRLQSVSHRTELAAITKRELWWVVFCCLLVVLFCTLPMSLSPIWNGEIPEHRNQYEVLAESILNGRVDMAYDDVDQKLTTMENPYDPKAREENKVRYHWDHAWYKGRYYMYFGVVPVFLLFIPYRLITGAALTTYHATQIFAALIIVGMFSFFYQLSKKFFHKISLGMYVTLSTAFSIISIWKSISTPALYCTANTAAICMEVWSFFFFAKALTGGGSETQKIRFLFLGALLGALTFGCRPPVGLANLIVIPLFFCFLRGKKQIGSSVFWIVLPYVVIAALIMYYNCARFDNPFEFGQSYQLTLADQHKYSSFAEHFSLWEKISGTLTYLLGALLRFPIFCFIIMLFKSKISHRLRDLSLWSFIITLLIAIVLVAALDVHWAPFIIERYRMDIYYLMAILCFVSIACCHESISEISRYRFSYAICMLSFISICACFIYFLIPDDGNFTRHYPDKFFKILTFGSIPDGSIPDIIGIGKKIRSILF